MSLSLEALQTLSPDHIWCCLAASLRVNSVTCSVVQLLLGMADKRESGGASSSKRVSWAPLPRLQGEAEEQDEAKAEV